MGERLVLRLRLHTAKFDKRMECTTCAVRGMLIGGFALEINCCIWSQICCFCAILSRNKYDF